MPQSLNELTSLSQMPTQWQSWHKKLCEVIDVDFGAINSIRSPLLIIPAKREIDESDADNLIGVIHNYLWGETVPSTGSLRQKLINLHPEASLPFLYVMRYIAFRDAGKHRYWPSLNKSLFNNKLEYTQVAIGLASVSSTLWLRLYEYTNGKLYFPREGLRNIKWPIAHAGLLPEDKEVLRDFGASLAEASGMETLTETIALETHEFVLVLRDWLGNLQNYKGSRIAQLMNGKGAEREVIAELGQQWLSAKRSELLTRSREDRSSINTQGPSVRRLLVYDAHNNHIQLHFNLKRTSAPPTLEWNNISLPFQNQFDSYAKEYVPLNLKTVLHQATWDSRAKLIIGSDSYDVTIPVLEKGKGIIFDFITGIRTTRWQFGQEYYLLISKDRFSAKTADQLFSDWISLGPPQGQWQDFDTLYIRTRDPFSKSILDLRENDPLELLLALEEKAENMGLPSFGHQYRPRPKLIGEFSQQVSLNGFPKSGFSADLPPYLEIHGVWKNELTIELSKLEDATGTYILQDSYRLDPSLAGSVPIIQLWQVRSSAGTYKITTGEEAEHFNILDPGLVEMEIHRLELDLWFEDTNGQRIVNPSRHALDDLALVIQSWPGADLAIEVAHSGISLTTPIPIQLNLDGMWNNPVRNLPVEFSNLPKGDLIVTTSWRGLYEGSIKISEKGHLVSELAQVTNEGSDLITFHCKGRIVGSLNSNEFYGCIFPSPPWGEKHRLFKIHVDDEGYFETTVHGLQWKSDWLAISDSPQFDLPASNLLGFLRTNDKSEDAKLLDISGNLPAILQEYSVAWEPLSLKLAEVSRPAALEPYFISSQFLSFIRNELGLPGIASGWVFYSNWEAIDSIRKYVNYKFSAGLFSISPSSGDWPQIGVPIQFIFDNTIGNNEKIDASFDLSSKYQLDGWIYPGENGKIRFETATTLRKCSKCGQIMRDNVFFGHKAHFKSLADCTGISPSFDPITSDHQRTSAVKIGFLLDPVAELAKLRMNLTRILNKENANDANLVELLKRLHQLVPLSADKGYWLQNLIDALETIERLLQQENINLYSLEKASRGFLANQAAMRMIFLEIKDRIMAL